MANVIDYDDISDSLFISRKREDEKVQGSAEIGNLVLDFTSDGKIVGVEINEISRFLEKINISPEILNNLVGGELQIQKQKDAVFIFILLQGPGFNQNIPIGVVPLTNPLPFV